RALGWERAAADEGRVGLGNPEDEADPGRRHPRSGRRLPRDRVRRGHIRIGAVVDIEHRALRPLEQDPPAVTARLVKLQPYRGGVRQDLRRDLMQLTQKLGAIDLLRTEAAQ